MERLTKKEISDITGRYFVYTRYANKESNAYIDKLGRAEDIEERHDMSIDEINAYITEHKKIEEELGVDLITLFKAIKNGIYVSEQNAENEIVWEEVVLNIHNKTFDFKYPRKEIGKGRPLAMFGKTWSLNKQILEK